MDKQQQIKEIGDIIAAFDNHDVVDVYGTAKALVDAGYGNLHEFAEKLKKKCESNSDAVGGCVDKVHNFKKAVVNELKAYWLKGGRSDGKKNQT